MFNEAIFLLKDELRKYNIELNNIMLNKFQIYLDMIIEWNKKINLTAITDPKEISIKHFLDSCVVIDAVNLKNDDKIIDIGTGAGFPGIPLKILKNSIDLTLLDSLNKRLLFLEKVKKNINIDATILHARAEELSKKSEFRETFDISISRAVSSLNILSEYCLPYVKIGGLFIAMKGPKADIEIEEANRAIELLGGRIKDVKDYNLLGDNKRKVIIIEKINSTPENYPRHGSKISKKPL